MYITEREIKEALFDTLERKPTKKELAEFKEFLRTDVFHQWLIDNAKYFRREHLK